MGKSKSSKKKHRKAKNSKKYEANKKRAIQEGPTTETKPPQVSNPPEESNTEDYPDSRPKRYTRGAYHLSSPSVGLFGRRLLPNFVMPFGVGLVQLFSDEKLIDPLGTIKSQMEIEELEQGEDIRMFYTVEPDIIHSHLHRSYMDSLAFFSSHIMTIAEEYEMYDDLKFDEMVISKFKNENGRKCIMVAVPASTLRLNLF